MLRSKRLRVFAGPNGSGKSTFFEGAMKIKSKQLPQWFVEFVLPHYTTKA